MIIHQLQGPWRGKPMLEPPKGIIIHAMGEYVNHQYAPDFVKGIGTSVHAFIAVDGKVLQAAETNRVAFHAGRSMLGHFQELNNFFLGVEVLVEGHHNMATFKKAVMEEEPYKEVQYEALGQLCAQWISQLQIDRQYVVGHVDVSGPSVRKDPKIDPGSAFDWSKFNGYVDQFLLSPPPIESAHAAK